MIPIFKPSLSEKEIKEVIETLKSGWWGAGPKAQEFEEKFAKYIGTKYAVSLNSCSAALHLAGKVLNIKEGSEVITTPLTFVSTLYLASYNNLKIVFADIEKDTLNIDPEKIKERITKNSKVILPVHFGGHSCMMDEINGLAKDKGMFVVEDCAHAAGSTYKGKKLGSLGTFGCFSFQAVKNLATGDGGMMTTNDEELYRKLRVLRWLGINKDTSERTGKDQYKWNYAITEVGYKYQMCDILASLGIAQLERLDELNKRRKEITHIYSDNFKNLPWIETPTQKSYTNSANHNYVIKISKDRELFMDYMNKKGISTGVHYLPAYKHPIFKHLKADCPVTEKIWTKLVTLPLYPDMTHEEIESVIDAVKQFK